MASTRRLAAILAADIVGYSRLLESDEAGTVEALREHRAAADPIIAEHGGRIVKTTGDGVLIELARSSALSNAPWGCNGWRTNAMPGPHERRTEWRIGVHLLFGVCRTLRWREADSNLWSRGLASRSDLSRV